ncbi:hypothetical protein MKW94_025486, partial [Papaver nudicaule]|nr:hypothetical protein [Papaver nudicaule]MCL7037343.1 hypothetical protein [Papaver nudicaule]MCL7042153.1 hypothetical protein [Papaver nudicaule]
MAEISTSNTNNNGYSYRANSSIPNTIVPNYLELTLFTNYKLFPTVPINNLNSPGNVNNDHPVPLTTNKESSSLLSIPFFQSAVDCGGNWNIFHDVAGCAAVSVNLSNDKVVTLPGIAQTWGLAVMVMIYDLGYIYGSHFNPAVTIAFATCGCGKFPWKQVPGYILAQVAGSTLAIGTLRLVFQGSQDHFLGTLPCGSNTQSFFFFFL